MPTYNIVIPEVFASHGPPRPQRRRSVAWSKVRAEYRIGDQLSVPAKQFALSRCVQDAVSYRIGEGFHLQNETGVKERGCVVVVLESPHSAEFESASDHFGKAIAPLQDAGSRAGLELHLGRLLGLTACGSGTELIGRQVILANSIQYQTSLQSLMTDQGIGLQVPVRNCVWHMLWNAGGREDFEARLARLEPALILMAPTAPVRTALAEMLDNQRNVPWIFADRHPCLWRRTEPHLRHEPRFRFFPDRPMKR